MFLIFFSLIVSRKRKSAKEVKIMKKGAMGRRYRADIKKLMTDTKYEQIKRRTRSVVLLFLKARIIPSSAKGAIMPKEIKGRRKIGAKVLLVG